MKNRTRNEIIVIILEIICVFTVAYGISFASFPLAIIFTGIAMFHLLQGLGSFLDELDGE